MDILIKRLWLMALLVVVWPLSVQAADDLHLREQQIKAGLLYNFLKYTQWPASSFAQSAALTVCVFGDDPFDGGLEPMKGRTVNQRQINVRYVQSAEDANGCHLLFISAAMKKMWPALRQSLSEKNILTVSDFDAFTAAGGMIELGRKDKHISASLNIDATAAAGLRIEERLLKLVTVVHGGRS